MLMGSVNSCYKEITCNKKIVEVNENAEPKISQAATKKVTMKITKKLTKKVTTKTTKQVK
jgi:hypothetical protein